MNSLQKKKKVFFFLYSLKGGGAERIMLSVLKGLDPQRYEARLLLCELSGDYQYLLPEGVPVYDLKNGGPRKFGRFRVMLRLLGILRQDRPDLVISTSKNTGLIALLGCFFLVIPARMVMRLTNLLTERAKEEGYSRLEWMSHRLVYSLADIVIAPSQAVLENFQASLKLRDPLRHRIIHNFVDEGHLMSCLKAEPPALAAAPKAKRVIVSIGRLIPRKRFELALRAYALLSEEDPEVVYWILGQGPSMAGLKEMAVTLGISNRVYFAGFQNNPYAFLGRADVFLMTSLYEGCPNAVLEAVYLGKPVITTRYNDSIGDQVIDGENGLIVDSTPEDIASALKALLQDNTRIKKMSETSLEKGRHWMMHSGIAQYENMFDELLEYGP